MPSVASHTSLALAALISAAAGQTYVDLNFSNNVQPATQMYPNNSTLGPYYTSEPSLDFANAGTYNGIGIDVRVSQIGLTDGETSNLRPTSTYEWVGWIPDYNTSAGSDDLGVYYRHDGNYSQETGGIAWSMSFYEAGSNFSVPVTLPGVRFLIYDHDGEPYQSESIRAFGSDGLVGYQLHNNSEISVVDENGNLRFDSRGSNHLETTADGGMILYYNNVSSVRFDWFATTQFGLAPESHGIFAAIDGNLGLTNGSTNGFGNFVPVPEPSTALLTGAAAAGMALRRRRC
ncbi:PEP-CTERM sorting domain-containing protein [Luteolibacter sp. GHJ8]|uniref:PEP-CTERM sorting domain-containing protein n=1 Tax=Luteolibacter rhizosphaerae TaxID=2989719 RepID=A0ABT3G297_9BACT|nr:PEP-CTERM sorting domain-containing protein [Luteolibacter rhizosphaerae]MCW1913953.1 PEP-CTERM sorting domain-containing protein [Luteolibacter rhizosphaerae]